jgi:PAS domain S-box-containing protein
MSDNFEVERKIEVSRWLGKTRWFYALGTLISFVLVAAACLSHFHFMLMAPILAFIFILANLYFYFISRKLNKIVSGQTEKLTQQSELRDKEMKSLDETTQLLTKRDQELSDKNWVLDAKIKELEASKNSLTKALNEVKQERLKSEEEKNKTLAIISNFNDPIIVLDKDSKLTLFNLAAKVELGLKNSDLGTAINVEQDFSLENFRSLIRRVFDYKKINVEKENNLLTEEMRVNEGGREIVYKVVTVRVKDSWENITGVMKLFYDITRERMIDQMKSDFISIAAHQLRTPLSAIKWSTGMIIAGDAGPINIEQENLLRKSYVSNEAMIALVNDLLNVSRIEEGRFGYIFKNLTIQEILDKVIANVKPEIDKAGINLSIDNQEIHTQVCMDKDKMILAMQNLLENAIKYTPRYGKILITVKRASDEQLMVSIKDSGVGIPKKEREKIFSKFFRASNVVLMETEGTGLGLFIVKNVIDKHGGQITLTSEENKGTEVTLKLPIECKI